jgi:hypothetical protein
VSGLVTYSRAILYDDASGIETGVSFDPAYRLGKDDKSYVRIKGVGEDVAVRVDHIDALIEWLRDVQAADRMHRHERAKGGAA